MRVGILIIAGACLAAATAAAHAAPPAGGKLVGRIQGKLADRLYVYLEGAPAGPPRRHAVNQSDLRFAPGFVVIGVGDTVDFPNKDQVTHNVFSVSKPKKFDLGLYATGGSKSVTFDRAGHVDLFCNIHSNMHANIEVVPSAHFAAVDRTGGFTLPAVPPGQYTLVVGRKGKPLSRTAVKVLAGKTATVDLSLP